MSVSVRACPVEWRTATPLKVGFIWGASACPVECEAYSSGVATNREKSSKKQW